MKKKQAIKEKKQTFESEDSQLSQKSNKEHLKFQIIVVTIVAISLVLLSWLKPRAVGDYYVALSAGRDMAESNFKSLTAPDTWSFMTEDKTWFNQNWGTHLLYYLTNENFGEIGTLCLKALLLLGGAFFITMGARQREVGWPLAILAGGTAIGGARHFIDIRPNLMTLTIAPLLVWFLLRTRNKSHRVWLAMLVIAIWANIHGGFIFGIAVMGLWVVCWFGCHLIAERKIKEIFRRYWPLLAALAGAMILSVVLSPFKLDNILHPFLIGSAKAWRNVTEWRPIYQLAGLQHTWEFYTAISLFLALPVLYCILHLVFRQTKRFPLRITHLGQLVVSICVCIVLFSLGVQWQLSSADEFLTLRFQRVFVLCLSACLSLSGLVAGWYLATGLIWQGFRIERVRASQVALLLFDVVLSLVVMTMAIKARRFIPLTLILIAPVVVAQISWFHKAFNKSPFPVVVMATVLFMTSFFWAKNQIRIYHPDHPGQFTPSVLKRMIGWNHFAPGAVRFINDNNISGRVFNEWRWEGFLRWNCPQLKSFIGGRAQQVYELEHFRFYNEVIIGQANPNAIIAHDIHLAVIPKDGKHAKLIQRMVEGPHARWAYIFHDFHGVVLADVQHPETRKLVELAAAGKLKYPSEDIAAMSQAMCLKSKVVKANPEQIADALVKALKVKPIPLAIRMINELYEKGKIDTKVFAEFLEKFYADASRYPSTGPDGFNARMCRGLAAIILTRIYQKSGNKSLVEKWQMEEETIQVQIEEIKARWVQK